MRADEKFIRKRNGETAKRQSRAMLREGAASPAVLLLDETLNISDRVVVMNNSCIEQAKVQAVVQRIRPDGAVVRIKLVAEGGEYL